MATPLAIIMWRLQISCQGTINDRSMVSRMLVMGLFFRLESKQKHGWNTENALEPLYAKTGRPAKPIRVMVGCLMLKRLDHRGDETLMDRWIENPDMRYFTGSDVMKHGPPCDPSDWRPMRDRMGQAGVEKIFADSVQLHQKEMKKSSSMVLSETTVQGNHGTFPTGAQRNQKVIDQ